MKDEVITAEERRCLRMWFRQAIAQLEQEEVSRAIAAELKAGSVKGTHRNSVSRRRTQRNRTNPHLRELVF
ncbi:MAG: hypothetical protein K2Z81_10955 [Cyanobacteria bacterium]|nr:hypothetical protein [Cyanobacteriota bacterium]